MSDDRNVDNIIDECLTFLDGNGVEPDLAALEPDLRRVLESRIALLRDGYGVLAEMPDLADDQVFIRMGFDRAGCGVELAGKKLKKARKAARLQLNDVVVYARNAGSSLNAADLFKIEQASSTLVPQPDASALVAALRVSLADLESESGQFSDAHRILNSDEFDEIIRQWADEHRQDFKTTFTHVKQELASTNFRADEVQLAQLRELLDAILRHMDP